MIFLNATGVTDLQLHDSTFSAFRSLERLHLISAGLKELKGTWFKYPNNINDLNMNSNSLGSLKQADLQILRNLTSADFSNNQIEILEEMVFADLPKLRYLDLRHNEIKQFGSIFPLYGNMQSLQLSYNSIENVSSC